MATRQFNVFPLLEVGGQAQAARLDELASVRSTELTVDRRVITLTDWGIYVLQQRLVHSLTRVVVELDAFEGACGHVLEEAALQEEWVDELSDGQAGSLQEQVAAFTRFMDDEGRREALTDTARRSGIRTAVRTEIELRLAA